MDHLLLERAEQHRQQLLDDAAQEHVIANHCPAAPQSRAHATLLAWMGERFIAWGWRLRARYGKVEHQAAL